MRINFIYEKKTFFTKEEKKQFNDTVNYVLLNEDKKLSMLNVVFCSDAFIRDYNRKYLNHDYETDILTFYDVTEDKLTEGELIISLDTVKRNSIRFKVLFFHEILRVLIHGVLHLCGYNDVSEKGKKIMKKKENYYLKNI